MYQKITIVGYLGKDPEMRYTPSGQAVTNFSVATSRQWTDNNGEKQSETTWFRVSAWGRQAETSNQYLKKGSRVLVEGRLKPDPQTGGPKIWTRRDGSPGASFEIASQRVLFMSSKNESQDNYQQENNFKEDDIPF